LKVILTRGIGTGSKDIETRTFLSKDTKNMYRIKIAIQISFIFWFMLGVLIFYATFAPAVKMWGTLLLLFSVVIFTPFLPDGAGCEDMET
jgi:hypothetical protein